MRHNDTRAGRRHRQSSRGQEITLILQSLPLTLLILALAILLFDTPGFLLNLSAKSANEAFETVKQQIFNR